MSGTKLLPGGSALMICSLYSTTRAVVVTGGFKLGMMIALPKCLALPQRTQPRGYHSEALHRTPGERRREPSRGDDRTHLCGSTASRTPPSRTWRCQSSGQVMTSCSCCCGVAAMAVALRFGRGEARKLTRQGGDSRRKGADEGFVCGCAQTVVVLVLVLVMAACIGFARFIL